MYKCSTCNHESICFIESSWINIWYDAAIVNVQLYTWSSFIHNLHKSRSVSRRGIDCLFSRKHNSDLTRIPYFRIAGNRAKNLQRLSSPVWMKHELAYLNIITARNICFSHTFISSGLQRQFIWNLVDQSRVYWSCAHTTVGFFTLQYESWDRMRALFASAAKKERRKRKKRMIRCAANENVNSPP